MRIDKLRGADSLQVTVHFDDMSAKDAFSLTRDFKKISKSKGLFIPTPNKYDALTYTDFFFRIPECPRNWEVTFLSSLKEATDNKGWKLTDKDGEQTIITVS